MYCKIKKILFGLTALFALSLMSCSNGSDDSSENETSDILELSAVQSTTAVNTVTLTWRTAAEAYKYYIYYSSENNSSTATKYSSSGYVSDEYDSSYKKTGFYKGTKDIGLASSGKYYFWVRSVTKDNIEGILSSSANCDFSYQNLTAPIDVSATQDSDSYNNVTVTWRDSKEAYKYYIFYNTENNSSTATKYSSSGYVSDEYDSSYKKTGFYKGSKNIALGTSGTYYFWIKAVDATGNESELSTSSSCIFTNTSLNVPIDVSVTFEDSILTITWRDSKEAYKYYIFYNTENNSSTAMKYSSSGYVSDEYDSSYKKTGFFKGSKELSLPTTGTYYFWIKGIDGTNHESDFSEVATYTYSE